MFPRHAIGTDEPHSRRHVRRSWRRGVAYRRAAGRRVSIARGGEAMGPLAGATDAYGYNGRSEVVSARRTLGGSPVRGFDEDFSYDPIGNRISATDYDENGTARTSAYSANALNQYVARTVPGWASARGLAATNAYVAVNGNEAYRAGDYFFGSDDFDNSTVGGFAELEVSAVVSAETNDFVSVATNRVFVPPASETYAYDADGNQTLVTTGTGVWQVEYNGENRPVKWTRVSPDSSTPSLVSMSYDHQGRRRLYVEIVGGVTNSLHRFTYDDYLCVARNREMDLGKGTGVDGFTWDPTEPVATRPLMCNPSTAPPFLYCHDGNKNVSEIVDVGTGEIFVHYEYSSFGKVVLATSERGDSASTINPYRFSSEYHDDAFGLVYYNYRHYNPGDGRWMGRDLTDEVGNLYGFCENNRLKYVDVLGNHPALLIPVAVDVTAAILEAAAAAATAAIAAKLAAEAVAQITTESQPQCESKKCKPCDPPVGTAMFKYETGHKHWLFAEGHTHHFKVNQSPAPDCRCFAPRDGGGKTTGGYSPFPGEINYVRPTGGGLAP